MPRKRLERLATRRPRNPIAPKPAVKLGCAIKQRVVVRAARFKQRDKRDETVTIAIVATSIAASG